MKITKQEINKKVQDILDNKKFQDDMGKMMDILYEYDKNKK